MDQCVSQGYHKSAARKIMEARDGRWGMLAGCSYAEPWMSDKPPRHSSLPVRDKDLDRTFYANDLPGGERRLLQKAKGRRYTIVNGTVTFEESECTGALPGQLLRSCDMVG